MQDLEIAKKSFVEKDLTLSIVKGGRVVFETESHGISGFLRAIEEFRERLEGASVADRVVGRAVGLLCVCSGVKAVYAAILSVKAKVLLEEHSVFVEWGRLVQTVLSADRAAACPFEELAEEISDPRDAYRRLKALQNSLRGCG